MRSNYLFVFMSCGLLAISSCKPDTTSNTEMNKGNIEDTVKTHSMNKDYFIRFNNEEQRTAGVETIFRFTPRANADTSKFVELQTLHDKKMHVIIVKKDLSLFYHVHPVLAKNGEYSIPFSFSYGGEYVIFVDYMPVNSDQQLERIELTVEGESYTAKEYTNQQLSTKIDDFEIQLIPENESIETMHPTAITVRIKRKGNEINANALDDYLGAKAHMVVISANTKEYIHVHPYVKDKSLMLHAEFPQPGMYRGWLQFQYKGQLRTAEFVFEVKQSKSDNIKSNHEHTH